MLTHSQLFSRGRSQLCHHTHTHTHNYSLGGECNPGNSRVMLFVCVCVCVSNRKVSRQLGQWEDGVIVDWSITTCTCDFC